jgi:hypothetical protein
MKRENVSYYIKIFGGFFLIVLSIIEIISLTLLLMMNVNINAMSMNLFTVVFNLNDLTLFVLWLSFMIILFCFLIFGFLSIILSSNKELDDYNYAKHMFIMGVIILISAFIQWEYIYLIGSHLVNGYLIDVFFIIPLNNIKTIFQYFDYSFYLWLIFSFTVSSKVILGLIAGGFGLHWVREKEKTME